MWRPEQRNLKQSKRLLSSKPLSTSSRSVHVDSFRAAQNRTGSTSPSGPRQSPGLPEMLFVGVPRIELGLPAPKAGVLPVYDTPTKNISPRKHTTGLSRSQREALWYWIYDG